MDKLYNNLTQSFVTTKTESLNFQKYFDNKDLIESKNKFESYMVRKTTKEVRKKYNILKAYPSTESEAYYKSLKKSLRRIQRREKYLNELREIDNLDKIAKNKNKTAFWKYIKKLKKRRSEAKEVTIAPEPLFKQYKSFFRDEPTTTV